MAQGGNILLETSSAILSAISNGQVSELSRGRLQVVIANVPTPQGQDQYLVIDVAGIEMAIATNVKVITQGSAYVWPAKRLHSKAAAQTTTPISEETDSGFVKLEFQSETVEERELFESILSGYTSFSDPTTTDHGHSRLVLMDESNGDIFGDLAMPFNEDQNLQAQIDSRHDDKEPVVVTFDGTTSPNGTPNVQISILSDVTSKYGKSSSKIVGGAEYLSRGILYGAEKLGSGMSSAASSYTTSTKPTDSPLVFSPTVKTGINKVHGFSTTAFDFTSKTLNAIVDVAGSVGTKVGGIGNNRTTKDGSPKPPGAVKKFLGNSFTAVNTVLESFEVGSKHVLSSTGEASTTVVGHRFGPDAADASKKTFGSLRHVVVVYIDARGVARKALVKGFGKSAVTAQFGKNGQVVLQPDIVDEKDPALNSSSAIPLGQPTIQTGYATGQYPQEKKQPPPVPGNKPTIPSFESSMLKR